MTQQPWAGWGLAVSLICFALTGCQRAEAPRVGQVLVRVNQDDISIHQLELALAQELRRPPSAADRETLTQKLVDRQLAVQQALSRGLDRRPEVMLKLEEVRRDVLAAALADEIGNAAAAPTDQQVAQYYREHPGLFAERKIYRVREVSVSADAPALTELQSRLERKDNFPEVLAWLRQQPGSFTDQQSMRPAEQLPIEVVDQLNRMRRGEVVAFKLPRALVVYELQSAELVPVSWAVAAPLIKAHLQKQQAAALFDTELKRLRAAAMVVRPAAVVP